MKVNRPNAACISCIALLAFLVAGCSPSVKGAAKSASEGATAGAVTTLDQPATQRAIAQIMSSPEMEHASRQLAGSMATGVTDAMASDGTTAQAERVAQAIAEAAARAATDAILVEMSTKTNQERLERLAAAVAEGAVDRATQRMATEVPRTVGPALGAVVQDEIGPSIQRLVDDPQVRAAMGSAVFQLSRQLVLGSNEATTELEGQKRHRAGLIAHLSTLFSEGGTMVAIVLIVLLLAVVALVIALVRERAHTRQFATARAAAEDVEHDVHRAGGRRAPSA